VSSRPTRRSEAVTRRRRVLLAAVAAIAAPLLLLWLVVALVFNGYTIPSVAMEPTLQIGDHVLARGVDGDDVHRGDLIVFAPPASANAGTFDRLMRVVAVEGDRIEADDGVLIVNGEPANEPYLAAGMTTPGVERGVVPTGHVFVMGDNRVNSADSRAFGPVPFENVKALVVVIWWPLGRFGGV